MDSSATRHRHAQPPDAALRDGQLAAIARLLARATVNALATRRAVDA